MNDGEKAADDSPVPPWEAFEVVKSIVDDQNDRLKLAEAAQEAAHKEVTRWQIIGAGAGLATLLTRMTDELPPFVSGGYTVSLVVFALSLYCSLRSFNLIIAAFSAYRRGSEAIVVGLMTDRYEFTARNVRTKQPPDEVFEQMIKEYDALQQGLETSSDYHTRAFKLLVGGSCAAALMFVLEVTWEMLIEFFQDYVFAGVSVAATALT